MNVTNGRGINPADMISKLTRFGKLLASIILGGYLASYIKPIDGIITLYPYKTILSFHIWNVLTCGYFEISLLSAIFSALFVLLISVQIEPIVGSKEMLKFIFIVNTSSTLSLFISIFLLYIVSLNKELWAAPFAGFSAIIGGFLVMIKQMQPDFKVNYFYKLQIRAKYMPLLAMTLSTVLLLLFGLKATAGGPLLLIFGVHYAWVYLRFFQRRESSLEYTVGDKSPEFSYRSMYPEFAQPIVGFIALQMGNISSVLGPRMFGGRSTSIGGYEIVDTSQGDTTAFHSERRRVLGTLIVNKKMKELDEEDEHEIQFREDGIADKEKSRDTDGEDYAENEM